MKNKKVYLILGIAVLLTIIIVITSFIYNKSANELNNAEIEKIVLSDWSSSVYSNYNIDNTGKIEFYYFNTGRENKITQNVSEEQIKQIFNIINSYDLNSSKWKKDVNKKYENYAGATSTSLEIIYTNGKNLKINNGEELRKSLSKELEEILDNISGINVDEI